MENRVKAWTFLKGSFNLGSAQHLAIGGLTRTAVFARGAIEMKHITSTLAVLALLLLAVPHGVAQETETAPDAGTPPKRPIGSVAREIPSAAAPWEERVADLKEKIFNSKSRLVLLKEQILHNVIAEAKGVIVHKNRMGAGFTLEQVLYHLDGNRIYFQDNKDGGLDDQREFEVFSRSLLPETTWYRLRWCTGGPGAFQLRGRLPVQDLLELHFYASKGRIVKVAVVGHERGGLTTSMEDKPYVSYEVEQFRYNKENLSKVTKAAD